MNYYLFYQIGMGVRKLDSHSGEAVMAMKKKRSISGTMRKLTRTGGYTYYVTIPKSQVEELGWREHQLLSVRRSGKKILVENCKGK